jgi:hypothetical protein
METTTLALSPTKSFTIDPRTEYVTTIVFVDGAAALDGEALPGAEPAIGDGAAGVAQAARTAVINRITTMLRIIVGSPCLE